MKNIVSSHSIILIRIDEMLANSRDIIKRLERDGWVHDRTRGDHHIYKKAGIRDHISITHPRKDVSIGLVKQIYKVAGWPRD